MNHDRRSRGGFAEQALLPGLATEDEPMPAPLPAAPDLWVDRLRQALAARSPDSLRIAEAAVHTRPGAPDLLLLAALAAIATGQAARALIFLNRYQKRFVPGKEFALLAALAAADQRQFARAAGLLEAENLVTLTDAIPWFVGDPVMFRWLGDRLLEIRRERAARRPSAAPPPRPARPAPTKPERAKPERAVPASPPAIPDLPRLAARFTIGCELVNAAEILLEGASSGEWFRLRSELTDLGLIEGFDELLCLPTLCDVQMHWFQIETVRKVLRQYRGRVLLADEVGLGKTVEAGMILKEYALRGMATRMLILTPPSLVGQWQDELAEKFGIVCATSHDPRLRTEPAAFWGEKRIIASIAAARRKEHAELLTGQSWDVVVVDEAHHLCDRSSAGYRLVNSLQKRFLLLLSATPVQNNLLELYNLLTLLKPGVFRTEKEFRAAHMLPGKPREPVNRDRLRDLMRGVMVRNTRALAALGLPRRHAATQRREPGAAEAECYRELTALARAVGGGGRHRLAIQHLLAAAGSSPAAAAAALARFAERHPEDRHWSALGLRYQAVNGAKEEALLALLARNPAEKKIVFVHHRDSMTHLAALFRAQGTPNVLFEGGMSGPAKDAAISAFRDQVPVLLSSESGGEGRNLQFCNTLINFDIPWNPMAIEQRIGRIDRIGQTREVFVFNLVTAGTVEDEVLRILDEKINMFELVVGEVGAILGEFDEQQDFSTRVLEAWLAGTEDARAAAFVELEGQLVAARRQYEGAKALDEALFGTDLDAA